MTDGWIYAVRCDLRLQMYLSNLFGLNVSAVCCSLVSIVGREKIVVVTVVLEHHMQITGAQRPFPEADGYDYSVISFRIFRVGTN